MTKQLFLLAVCCLLSSSAYGQTSLPACEPAPTSAPVAVPNAVSLALTPPALLQDPSVQKKRPGVAALLPVGTIAGGLVLGYVVANALPTYNASGYGLALWGAALAVGPSVGHLYAGDKQHARRMIAARAVTTAVGAAALSCSFHGGCEAVSEAVALPALLLSGVALPILFSYDLVDSLFVVQRLQGRPVSGRIARTLQARGD